MIAALEVVRKYFCYRQGIYNAFLLCFQGPICVLLQLKAFYLHTKALRNSTINVCIFNIACLSLLSNLCGCTCYISENNLLIIFPNSIIYYLHTYLGLHI